MKSGNLNFLEFSGALQACNGTDLPLPLPFFLTLRLQRIVYILLIFGMKSELYSFTSLYLQLFKEQMCYSMFSMIRAFVWWQMCTFPDPFPPACMAFCFTGGYSHCHNNNNKNNNVQLGQEWVANPHTQQFEHKCNRRGIYISTKYILIFIHHFLIRCY